VGRARVVQAQAPWSKESAMSQVRYFVLPLQNRWTVRRDIRRIGAFGNQTEAIAIAIELAAADRIRGHVVQVLKQDADGRWDQCAN
jgi:hypothetical protein